MREVSAAAATATKVGDIQLCTHLVLQGAVLEHALAQDVLHLLVAPQVELECKV